MRCAAATPSRAHGSHASSPADTSRKAPDLVRITGPLVQEVIQTYNPTYNASVFVQQTLRLYSDAAAAAGTAPATDLDVRTYIDSFMVLGMNHTFKARLVGRPRCPGTDAAHTTVSALAPPPRPLRRS